MTSETFRIADQLRRAFNADAWHGPALRELLAAITAEQASARPLPSSHTIFELVLHIDVWTQAALDAIDGVPMPKDYGTEKDWPRPGEGDPAVWAAARDHLFGTGERLAQAIEGLPESRLADIVPGRRYDFYFLFHGVVQHGLYHGGQIAILKNAVAAG